MALADLLKTFKKDENEDNIIQEMERYLIKRRGPGIGRPYEERMVGVHHPSVLSSVECMRRYVYSWLDTKRSNPQDDPKGKRIFHTGDDYGCRLQGYFYEMGILLGEWLCIKCEHRWVDMENPSPKVCPNCGAEFKIWYNLHYLEVPFVYPNWGKYGIAGKADGALKRPRFSKRQLVEIKTIKNRDSRTGPYAVCFEDLVEPQGKHTAQLNMYLHMASDLYGNDFDSGFIIYGAKNTQEWKRYNIRLMPELIDKLKVKTEIIESFLEKGAMPLRLGKDKTDRKCRYCDWKDTCWTEHTFAEVDRRAAKK